MAKKQKTDDRPLGSVLVERLSGFRDALQDGKPIEKRYTVRTVELDLVPSEYDPESVRATRDRLGMSQAVFAKLLGVSVETIHSWETGKREPRHIACRFMDEFNRDPGYWRDRIADAATPSASATECSA